MTVFREDSSSAYGRAVLEPDELSSGVNYIAVVFSNRKVRR